MRAAEKKLGEDEELLNTANHFPNLLLCGSVARAWVFLDQGFSSACSACFNWQDLQASDHGCLLVWFIELHPGLLFLYYLV